jgi:hypothetical protein
LDQDDVVIETYSIEMDDENGASDQAFIAVARLKASYDKIGSETLRFVIAPTPNLPD